VTLKNAIPDVDQRLSSFGVENSAGTLFTNWNDQNGVAQCPGQPTLRLASAYVAAPEIQKALLAAGLSHKPLHVWFEATSGVCYIKQVTVTM